MADRLMNTLNEATGFNPEQRTEAMKLLETWEVEPNYHLSLQVKYPLICQQIYMDHTIPQKTRSLAIISLKNGINKYWRKSARGAISSQEKTAIKLNLLSYLNEPILQLANTQVAVTSRIARFDFPNEWPDLLDVLIPVVQKAFQDSKADESALRHNSLYTLHLSMKALCTKTLPAARRLAQTIATNVFKYLSSLLYSQITVFFDKLSDRNASAALEAIRLSRLSLKCVRRIMIKGYQYFSQNQECVDFITFLTQVFPKILSIRSQECDPQILKLVDGFVKLIGKIVLDCTQDRVIDFILVPSSIVLIKQFNELLVNPGTIVSIGDDDMLLDSVQIQAIKALKNLVSHSEYYTVPPHRDQRIENALSVLQSNLFTSDFILSTARLMISQYTLLNEQTLQEWQDDPEAFFQEEESDVWEYNQRRCAEKLVMLLISSNKALLCPFLIESLKGLPNDYSFANLKFRESLYAAMGHGAFSLGDFLDFGELLPVLASECNRNEREWKIIKRRVAILISKWVAVKPLKNQQQLIYQVLLSLSTPSNDLVVRLTAVNCLKAVVDDIGFETTTYVPHLQQTVDCFMHLLSSVDYNLPCCCH
jgi:Importin-beta N-terminal domain